ncbi:sigma-54 interaction domain-containing protein [Fusobacterium animalis]|uniref:sigma-54 interaction domain-containing protein n=1 Tax=Fusobacterium animalis TaxID=76859 RepID=UPI0021C45C52|nr:sigma 54-interacting transcriptional regulator [Fusobacterium animalis]
MSLNDSNVLITGESGTGKKVYAHAIHNESDRANYPFISVNCTTFSKENLEKELFGLEQDVFYDDKRRKIGLLQLVDGGTLLLDEISELDYSLQTKLLHVLQEKTLIQIGGLKEIPVDFRLICTTNKNLLELVNQGKFRKDLYYRISVIPLNLLPLKSRKGDIPALANKFLKDLSIKYRREISFSEDVIKILLNYDWSGNIRELRNIVEFLFNISDGTVITVEDLPDYLHLNKKIESYKNLNDYLRECEKKYIRKVLNNFENSLEGKKKAAKLLGISIATLYNKLS